jgi:transposase-like protein
MAVLSVKCPYCGSAKVVRFGKQPNGVQRYACRNDECSRSVFQLDYKYHACEPGVKFRILEMAINGSGVRDISRVLHISADVVIETLKKRKLESAGKSELSKLP